LIRIKKSPPGTFDYGYGYGNGYGYYPYDDDYGNGGCVLQRRLVPTGWGYQTALVRVCY
jgi:hypothetical protein